MVETVKTLRDALKGAELLFGDEGWYDCFSTFGGDGFLLAIRPDKLREKAVSFISTAAQIHSKIRLRLLELSPTHACYKNISLRMGLNCGEAIIYSEESGRSLLMGSALNDAQRVMDCARDWHILVSEKLAHLTKNPSQTKAIGKLTGKQYYEFSLKAPGFDDLKLTECIGPFKQKHNTEFVLWWLYGRRESIIGVESPPPKGPRHVDRHINDNVLHPVTDAIESGAQFFSVTLMPPSVWLTDPTLALVLLTQARQNPSAKVKPLPRTRYHPREWHERKPDGKLHHRVFILTDPPAENSEQMEEEQSQQDLLIKLHHVANVEISFLRFDQLQSVFDVFSSKVKDISIPNSSLIKDFRDYPVREFWITTHGSKRSKTDASVKDAGYGLHKNARDQHSDIAKFYTPDEKAVAAYWKESVLMALPKKRR